MAQTKSNDALGFQSKIKIRVKNPNGYLINLREENCIQIGNNWLKFLNNKNDDLSKALVRIKIRTERAPEWLVNSVVSIGAYLVFFHAFSYTGVLCISTSKQVLCTLFPGRNHIVNQAHNFK